MADRENFIEARQVSRRLWTYHVKVSGKERMGVVGSEGACHEAIAEFLRCVQHG